MPMTLREARRELLAISTAGNASIIDSPSGYGKSSMTRQLFEYLRERDAPQGIRWGYGSCFLATQTPPDLVGFQHFAMREFTHNGKSITLPITEASVPMWFISDEGIPATLYDRYFLVLDEYGQGEADVKRSAAEILLNGKVGPWQLPMGSVRVACTNLGVRYGVSKDFDFCIARRTSLSISKSTDVWLEDFAEKPYFYQGRVWQTLPVVKHFAKQNPEILFEAEPEKQGPWCNPRTLCSADRYLQVAAEQNDGKIPAESYTLMESLAGTIGMPATNALINHLQFLLELPPYEDVVKDPVGCGVPAKPDMQMLMVYQMAHYVQKQHLAECITYINRFPKDLAVTFVTSLLKRDYKSVINEPAMQAWVNKNAALVHLVNGLAR